MEVVMIVKNGRAVACGHFEFYHEAQKFAINFFKKNGTDGYSIINPTFYSVAQDEVVDNCDIIQMTGAAFMQCIFGRG